MISLIKKYFRTPYNRFSSGGFIVFLIHQSLNQYTLFGTQNCCLSLFIGPCFFLDALCTDFRMHFKEMDRLSGKNDSASKHRLKLMVLDAIRFQKRIVELSIALRSWSAEIFRYLLTRHSGDTSYVKLRQVAFI